MNYVQFHSREVFWESNGYILWVNVSQIRENVPIYETDTACVCADRLHYDVFIHLDSVSDRTEIVTQALIAKHDLTGLKGVEDFAEEAFSCLPLIGFVKTPNGLRAGVRNIILEEIISRNTVIKRVDEKDQEPQLDYITW